MSLRAMGLVLGRLLPGKIRRRALVALGGDHTGGHQLADGQREVVGAGPELLVDLLDAQPGMALDERGELLRQGLEVGGGALDTSAAARTADTAIARQRDESNRAALAASAIECRFQRVDGCAPRELGDLRHEVLNGTIHLSLKVAHSCPRLSSLDVALYKIR